MRRLIEAWLQRRGNGGNVYRCITKPCSGTGAYETPILTDSDFERFMEWHAVAKHRETLDAVADIRISVPRWPTQRLPDHQLMSSQPPNRLVAPAQHEAVF